MGISYRRTEENTMKTLVIVTHPNIHESKVSKTWVQMLRQQLLHLRGGARAF